MTIQLTKMRRNELHSRQHFCMPARPLYLSGPIQYLCCRIFNLLPKYTYLGYGYSFLGSFESVAVTWQIFGQMQYLPWEWSIYIDTALLGLAASDNRKD